MNIQQAVIIAGGRGTRLQPFTDTNPKPMYPINNKPFIGYLVEQVRGFGINNILILLGYMPQKIQEYLGDGSGFGVNITYDVTPEEVETGARIYSAYVKGLFEEQFLFLYCDNYCPINYDKLIKDKERNMSMIQMSAYSNRDDYTRGNLLLDEKGLVKIYDKNREVSGLKAVDIGYAIIEREVISYLEEHDSNFEKSVYPKLVEEQKLYVTVCEHRYYSVGSWNRMPLTESFFKEKKFVFLDRDGTINVRPSQAHYINTPEEFVWLPKAKAAIKRLTDEGYMVFLITNQPGIARGDFTEETLEIIHEKMNNDLQKLGTKLERIYVCPHNWNDGCFCRKPSPGMLYQAQKDYSLNLADGVFFGDDERDMEAAKRANMRGVLVREEYSLYDAVDDFLADEEARR